MANPETCDERPLFATHETALDFQRCDVSRCPHRVDYLERRLRHLEEQIRASDETIRLLTDRLEGPDGAKS